MTFFDAIFLGIFQGTTEFLPISSSGHLVLMEYLFSLPNEELLVFDAVLHGGSFLSLLFLFRKEIARLFSTFFHFHSAKKEEKNLLFFLLFATLPTVCFGIFLKDYMEIFRTPSCIAILFAISAGTFFLAERVSVRLKKNMYSQSITKKTICLAAIFQIFSLLPGISRSGIVTVAGIFSGIRREKATYFSFLLGIPIIFGAFLFSLFQISSQERVFFLSPLLLLTGFFSSAISGFFVARFLLIFFKKYSLQGFGIYLLLLSILILFFQYHKQIFDPLFP